jgi:hypothetical protein
VAEAEHPADAAGESPRGPARSLDDFITYSEIEQKLGQVAKPGATPKPARSSPNWRWGILAAVMGFGLLRGAFSSSWHSSTTPSYSPPQQRPIHFGMQEVKKEREENRRALPPGGAAATDEDIQRELEFLRMIDGDKAEIERLENELALRRLRRANNGEPIQPNPEQRGQIGPPKP